MVKNTEKSTSGCWPRNVSDSEDSSPGECLHTQSVFLQRSQGQEGGSERAVRKQIMKTGDHGCDDGGHCHIYRSV